MIKSLHQMLYLSVFEKENDVCYQKIRGKMILINYGEGGTRGPSTTKTNGSIITRPSFK
jgi:predicted aconitase with swiveling domain